MLKPLKFLSHPDYNRRLWIFTKSVNLQKRLVGLALGAFTTGWEFHPFPRIYYAHSCYVLLMYTINIGYASFFLSGEWYQKMLRDIAY